MNYPPRSQCDHAVIPASNLTRCFECCIVVLKRKLAKREEVLTSADQVLASQDSEIKNLRRYQCPVLCALILLDMILRSAM